MNKIDFTQTGGFPFDESTLRFLQDSIFMSANTARLAGRLAILSGCVVDGLNAGDGVVIIDGEILPFVGGAIEEKVIIVENISTLPFQNGDNKGVVFTRYAKFGDDGVTNNSWSAFKRNTTEGILARLERLEWLTAPDLIDGGSMRLWRKPSSVALPAGWREVVDWQDRVLRGRKPGITGFEVGDIGGQDDFTLDMGYIPEHSHGYKRVRTDNIGEIYEPNTLKSDDERGLHTGDSVQTDKAGSATPKPVPTLPKYRIVMFIEPIPNYIPNAA
ncbi:hypothetical protein ACCC92_24225 [Mucilaginibacter sp. Mucisp84]|uniref:hypothetical protein n=1 Tax=Mucilaginibacter sp. Mucisp84 TaxID=3243058 RepID=UPI0039A4DB39